jgi:hypothetical protein
VTVCIYFDFFKSGWRLFFLSELAKTFEISLTTTPTGLNELNCSPTTVIKSSNNHNNNQTFRHETKMDVCVWMVDAGLYGGHSIDARNH